MISIRSNFVFSQPRPEDGLAIHELIQQCPPLDLNSSYCYMLCCTLWADTSICVWQPEEDNPKAKLVGFISALVRPDQDNTLFVWQVAVADTARGQRLAQQMLTALLQRNICQNIDRIHTTISPDNQASWRTFNALADQLGCASHTESFLDQNLHFKGQHDSELLFVIGPFSNPPPKA